MIAPVTTIADTKGLLGTLPSLRLDVPDYIYTATDNARCSKSEIFVKEGDHVYMGQLIGMRDGGFFKQPIHSSVSGIVDGFEEHYHRSGKKVKFVRVKNDHKDEWDPSLKPRSDEEIAKLTRADFSKILEDCAMVGLGGSSFPTYVKFNNDKKIEVILINAIECEPYITADVRLMEEELEKTIEGMKYLMIAFECKKVLICVKKKHKSLIKMYQEFLRRDENKGISVCPVGNFYPQGWEIAMIKSALGIDIPSGHLPSEFGIANFNVSTVWGIYEAVKYNRPVVERFISVTGDGIRYPSNFRVRIGTPLKLLLDKCGGYTEPEKDKVFILGGPMMGASLPSDDCIITKTVTSVLVFNHVAAEEGPCIRCGSCVYSCPTHLEPKQIMDAVKAFDKERIKALNPLRCIECGLCTYVCTSHIRVTDYIRRAKMFAKTK
ncbi:MAG: RnfABCDGE type electron transport complex subunit C [Bacilli bacterium]|nr:RnfABCDGE type electron transport complex subunit C [Bacilli bacterium]